MEFLNNIWKCITLATVMDVFDILIVATLIYKLIKIIRNTSAARLLKGVLLLLVTMQISDWLELHVINFLLVNTMQMGVLALVIVFQPELRKVLEQFGKSRISFFKDKNVESQSIQMAILQTVEAASALSWAKTGALIVFEKRDNISGIIRTGTEIDSVVSAELLKNIFYPKAPLHDGAVVVSDGRVQAAGCLLPLSANLNISKDLGTRHRAALGMSEAYDAACVVVSEETGAISFAMGGMLKRHLSPENLEKLLTHELIPQKEEKQTQSFWEKLKGGLK